MVGLGVKNLLAQQKFVVKSRISDPSVGAFRKCKKSSPYRNAIPKIEDFIFDFPVVQGKIEVTVFSPNL